MKTIKLLTMLFFLMIAVNALAAIDPPTATLAIAGNASYTSSPTPELTINITGDVNAMAFSCPNGTYTDFMTFTATYSGFNITDGSSVGSTTNATNCSLGDGNKTVYVKVRTTTGTESAPSSDSIILDSERPTISVSSPVTPSTTENRTVTFDVNDSGDWNSGINLSQITVKINDTTSATFNASSHCTGSRNYTCTYTENAFDLNNTSYTIKIDAKDNAGNSATQALATFTYIDTNSPAQVTGLTATAGNQQVVLSWSAVTTNANGSTANDINAYLVYMHTASGSSFDTNSGTLIATVTAPTVTYTKTGLSNGTTYYFKVSAKDKSGNEGTDSEEKNAAPSENTAGIGTPSISSPTHTNDTWSTNNDPRFSWASVSNATYYSHVFNQTSDSVPTENKGTSLEFNPDGTQSDGIWYFHLRACTQTSCSSTTHFKVKIDRTGPNQPPNFSATANANGTISLEWDASTDSPSGDNSGIKEYGVYRHHEDDFDTIDSRKIATVTATNYEDSDDALNNGQRYYYKIRPVDNAGNAGQISPERSAIFQAAEECENTFSYNFTNFIGGETFTLRITSTSAMTQPQLKLRIPVTGFIPPENIDTTSTSIIATYALTESLHGKTAEITFTVQDTQGNTCFERKNPKIDRHAPEISFSDLEENDDLLLDQKIVLSASDEDSGIKEVKLFFRQNQQNFVLLGNAEHKSGNNYEFEESLNQILPGEAELKAEATDNAGNKKEIMISVNAKSGENVFAQQSFTFTNNTLNQQKLEQAGIKTAIAQKARSLIQSTKPSRSVEITKDGNDYLLKVRLSFTNNEADTKSFKVIEIIPKEIAQSASEIESSQDFRVIMDDPVIEFAFDDIEADGTVSFSYELKDNLTETEAESLAQKLENGLAPKLKTPPIILFSEENTQEIFSAQPLPPQEQNIFLLLIAGVVILVVLILVIAVGGGAAVLHLHRKKNMTEMEKKFSESQKNMTQKSSDKLSGWLEQKEKESTKKRKFEFGK